MKRAVRKWVPVLLLWTALGASAQEVPPVAESELVARARQFLSALQADDFEAACRDFDATMRQVANPEKLAEFWKMAPAQLGNFVSQGAARGEKLGDYDIVLISCRFSDQTLDARVVFDREKKIAGFQFVPPASPWQPPAYADPALFREKEVTVGGGDWPLPATLTLPRGAGPFPALVLVHGSGPNDRDETVGPNKTFKDLAWGLATRGVAVLRYEKRTRVHGAKLVADPTLSASFTVREETVDDALAAVRLLRGDPAVDPRRIFVLGHSLGGMLVPRIAAAGGTEIAGFVIMAGLTRKIDDTILEQTAYLAELDGTVTAWEKARLEEVRAAVARIRALRPGADQPAQALLAAPPAYWLDLRGYDPAVAAKAIRQPLLVLQGGRDYQVTARDFANWKRALDGRKDVTFRFYPALNHLFFAGRGPGSPDEYMRGGTNLAPEVLEEIAAWVKSR